jgi:hypothetical protein
LQGVANGFLIDEDVGQQRIFLQLGGGGAQMVQAGLQIGAIGGGDIDAGGRHGFDGGLSRRGRGETERGETGGGQWNRHWKPF